MTEIHWTSDKFKICIMVVLVLSITGAMYLTSGCQQLHIEPVVRWRHNDTGTVSNDTGGGGAKCNNISTRYTPSTLERTWMENIHAWGNDATKYCQELQRFEQEVQVWLKVIADNFHSKSLLYPINDTNVFSRFDHTSTCGEVVKQHSTWIEPLSHGLRHPINFCPHHTNLVERGWLLLGFAADHQQQQGDTTSCVGRDCQVLFFDVGASTWNTGLGAPSQSWFTEAYTGHGLTFDRMIMWEATFHNHTELFKNVPLEYMHKYQYFNVPASPDPTKPSSPVRILERVAQRGDYVVFKLDIDTPDVEMAIVNTILNSPHIAELIDEFLFEHHVNFPPMNIYWNTSGSPTTLVDSYKLFSSLRSKYGMRAHSWV
jgi:hypothetical protein